LPGRQWFHRFDFSVLSFNYRGVGKSSKPAPDLPLFEYWNRLDTSNYFSEIILDTEQVIELSGRYFKRFHLVGYSFGCFIGLSALPETALSFAGITPPLAEHDFSRLSTLSCTTFLLFAEKENLLIEKKAGLPGEAVIHEIAESDHFFSRSGAAGCGSPGGVSSCRLSREKIIRPGGRFLRPSTGSTCRYRTPCETAP